MDDHKSESAETNIYTVYQKLTDSSCHHLKWRAVQGASEIFCLIQSSCLWLKYMFANQINLQISLIRHLTAILCYYILYITHATMGFSIKLVVCSNKEQKRRDCVFQHRGQRSESRFATSALRFVKWSWEYSAHMSEFNTRRREGGDMSSGKLI